jgi:hypothetical protein
MLLITVIWSSFAETILGRVSPPIRLLFSIHWCQSPKAILLMHTDMVAGSHKWRAWPRGNEMRYGSLYW